MSRLTTEEFISRAKAIHGDKYDYSKTKYTRGRDKVRIICRKHGVFEQIADNHINPRIRAGCPYCAHKKVFPGESDLLSQYPDVAATFDETKNGVKASQVFARSNKKYWWTCKIGHSFEMSMENRTYRKVDACPYCSGQKLLKGFNDLQTRYPELSSEWNYEKNIGTPSDYRYGSGYKAWWVCPVCGESYQSPINTHIQGHGCPYCAGTSVIHGQNDLKTLYPVIADEYSDDNKIPVNQVSAHSHKKVKWICPICGNEYTAAINKRTCDGTGCPKCNMSGPEQYIYNLLKSIGVTFKTQETFPELKDKARLRFDFTLYDNDKLVGVIKYNGQQHYKALSIWGGQTQLKRREAHQLKKINFCAERNIPILIVPYSYGAFQQGQETEIAFMLYNLGLIDDDKRDELICTDKRVIKSAQERIAI